MCHSVHLSYLESVTDVHAEDVGIRAIIAVVVVGALASGRSVLEENEKHIGIEYPRSPLVAGAQRNPVAVAVGQERTQSLLWLRAWIVVVAGAEFDLFREAVRDPGTETEFVLKILLTVLV